MARFDEDPRTRSADGAPRGLSGLGEHIHVLWRALAPDEQVHRFITDVTLLRGPNLTALTPTRLLRVQGVTPKVVSMPRPLAIEVGGSPGRWKVQITARDGTRLTITTNKQDDVTALQAADHLGSTTAPPVGRSRGTSVPSASSTRSSDAAQPSSSLRQIESWQDAEVVAVEHMHHLGFDDARATPGGADGGLDAIASTAAAQVKFHAVPTGAPAVQQLFGAAHDYPNRLFYATGYTAEAQAFADRAGIALFRLAPFGVIEAANPVAVGLAGGQPAPRETVRPPQDAEVTKILGWCEQVVKAAQWNTGSTRAGMNRRIVQDRQTAADLASAALASIDRLNDVGLGKFRRRMLLAEAETNIKKAGRLIGIKLR